jgi:hypothetical protein
MGYEEKRKDIPRAIKYNTTLSLLFTERTRVLLVDDMVSSNGSLLELSSSFLTIEQGSGLFECASLGLDDEEVHEDELKGDPATVDDLVELSVDGTRKEGQLQLT